MSSVGERSGRLAGLRPAHPGPTVRFGPRISPPAPERTRLTSQGHPRTVFLRALERGSLLIAEAAAREVGTLDLREALDLTALVARHERARRSRFAVRWLERYLAEQREITLDDAELAVALLRALSGPHHAAALVALRELAKEAPRERERVSQRSCDTDPADHAETNA